MVFQIVDRTLSAAFDVPLMPYGSQLMEDPSLDDDEEQNMQRDSLTTLKQGIKIILAPAVAGVIESAVSNRAEVQRFYGISKFAQVENSLKWNPLSRLCGPAFMANASRNCIMSATSFVITPVLYRTYYPQQNKSKTSLFWFGLGVNVFIGNTVAITQQSLWGRALDYAAGGKVEVGGNLVARNIHYKTVIKDSIRNEGLRAFYTVPKWASRVMMNAPVQGTLPWFYNEVLPLAEVSLLNASTKIYHRVVGHSTEEKKLLRKFTKRANDDVILYSDEKTSTTATSPLRSTSLE